MSKNFLKKTRSGMMLVAVLVAMAIFLIVVTGALSLGLIRQKLNIQKVAKNQALYIAEAGLNYYRWVLYHNHSEYCNKETCKTAPDYGPYGPYAYTDYTGTLTGYYELYITPPALNGSTIVRIKSIGWTSKYPNVKRTIEVECGIPSWSTYSWLLNSNVNFGSSASVWEKCILI